ncbi:MAG: alpha/beta hydrolase [Synoicihabitans sp.]
MPVPSRLLRVFSAFIAGLLLTLIVHAQPSSPPPITHENVAYGDHTNQIMDVTLASISGSAPAVIYIHGGGFTGGSHDRVSPAKVQRYLDAGIHHISVEYRLLKHAPFPAPHEDAVRALQFIRSKAAEWGIDKNRIAAYGGSAGAQLVAYLAWSEDFANPESDDPVARESSRLKAVAPLSGQSTMDLNWWVENIPGYEQHHRSDNTAQIHGEVLKRGLVHEISIINHITSDDPPTFMSYGMRPDDPVPDDERKARNWKIHHINFGIAMDEKLRLAGVESVLKYPLIPLPYADDVAFLIHHLQQ